MSFWPLCFTHLVISLDCFCITFVSLSCSVQLCVSIKWQPLNESILPKEGGTNVCLGFLNPDSLCVHKAARLDANPSFLITDFPI